MSDILGCLRLDGMAPDRSECERMLALSMHRGPDDCGLWSHGPAAFGHAQFRSTPEAIAETQPLQDPAGQAVIVFDGRVDNRADLRNVVQANGGTLRDASDAELVLQLCLQLGSDAPSRIIGDFAFAFWDVRARRLLCARDPMGLRPFYYHLDKSAFHFATELPALLSLPGLTLAPNEGMVAEYLACRITSHAETLYANVLRLPPGHLLCLDDGGAVLRRFWQPDPKKTLRYQDPREYAEHFQALFEEAVRARLRSTTDIGIQLSGGLDSSSVACTAQLLAKKETAPALEMLSLVFPGQACDEQSYIQDVVQAHGMNAHPFRHLRPTMDFCGQWARRFRDFPGHPNGLMFEPVWQFVRERALRVCLAGTGGDDWLQGADSAMRQADCLRHGRMLSFIGALLENPGEALAALKHVLRPNLPPAWLARWRRRNATANLPAWLDKDFVRRTNLEDRIRVPLLTQATNDYAWDYHYQTGTGAWQVHALECEERCAAWHGFEYRYPFLDRRLVEFSLALPESQRGNRGETKVVLREAMRGRLPERVRTRTDKASFEGPVRDALRMAYHETAGLGALTASRGWTLESSGLQAFARVNESEPAGITSEQLWELWMLLGIETWLRHGLNPGHPAPKLGKVRLTAGSGSWNSRS
ncbi:MAG: asparagine synthase (glutamine-hydrolyzing) [Planctomycetota bacterium]|nr:asparagine synthase (glutamine-hydrolyzing) [Planctomycetota bacterium]